jgi:hypothetical protein
LFFDGSKLVDWTAELNPFLAQEGCHLTHPKDYYLYKASFPLLKEWEAEFG